MTRDSSSFWTITHTAHQRHQSWGLGVATLHILGWGLFAGWVVGGVKYYYILLCAVSRRKWWLLKRNIIICSEVAVNEQFVPGKSKFFKLPEKNRHFSKICLKELKFFTNLPGKKIEIFREIAWKNRNFSKISLEKSKFCWPGSTTLPDFKSDWRRCNALTPHVLKCKGLIFIC